ncbi:MAG: hypothetical protein U5K51_12015 [Flavobacteriaceae bacterium]|nr:hypothetical protein [Flavobacteriaceae bacterium]
MKKYLLILIVFAFAFYSCNDASVSEDPMLKSFENKKITEADCASIQDGILNL